METLAAFQLGDGAHCGLSDWYDDKRAALQAALDAHAPFDTGWYASKKEIASARIQSDDGETISVKASVSDDFDTQGLGEALITEWTLDAVAAAVCLAWDRADDDRQGNEVYEGFSIYDAAGRWVETFIRDAGYGFDSPPGDNYHWWGWQHDEADGVGIPDPDIPAAAVKAFEAYVEQWDRPPELTIDGWTIRPWRD